MSPAIPKDVNAMSHEELCRRWRFDPPGTGIFADEKTRDLATARFKLFGGMTPEMSKRIGLGR